MKTGDRLIKNRFSGYLFSVIFGIFGFALTAHNAAAATLYFSPASGTYTVGQKFSVFIDVSSPDRAMNAVSGTVVFPENKLKVDSISKSGSIISLWINEPTFSANAVNFEGFVLNPGYTGNGAKILTINFSAIDSGEATLNFSAPQVLANDGHGTAILGNIGSAKLSINKSITSTPTPPKPESAPTPAGSTTPKPPLVTDQLPPAPIISSPSCPEEGAWCSAKAVEFKWTIPANILGVSVRVDNGTSSLLPVGSLNSYTVNNVKDGTNHLGVRFKNSGGWGPTTDYKFMIDTVPPEAFDIKLIDQAVTENTKPAISWSTTDTGSGLDRYELRIDDQDAIIIKAAELAPGESYVLPEQTPGEHQLSVAAIDKAGNRMLAKSAFAIKRLEKPVITAYTATLNAGDQIAVEGETGYPGAGVTVWILKNREKPQVINTQADRHGHFNVVSFVQARQGDYSLWVQSTNNKGAKSQDSDTVNISVASPYQTIIILNIIFLALMVLLMVLFIRRLRGRIKNKMLLRFIRFFARR